METTWSVEAILGAARGSALATDKPAIGTEDLLAGVTGSKSPACEALAATGATKNALLAVLRDRAGRADAWTSTDDAAETTAAQDILGADADRRVRFTGAATAALTAAMEHARRCGAAKLDAVHLLRGLLAADNRAADLLAACGVSPEAVLGRLDGGTEARDDELAPLLHPTRDILLGRGQYRHLSVWKRWLVKNTGVNLASRPAQWIGMETYEQARRLGDGTVGTEHILLAVLATHEVAFQHPHLAGERAPEADFRYSGGERLARLGIDYTTVHKALTDDRVRLTGDARPAKHYIEAASADSGDDPGTGPLVDTLLTDETRARQLIEALTATPGD